MVLINKLMKCGACFYASLCAVLLFVFLASCNNNNNAEPEPNDTITTLNPSDVDASKIYIPEELSTQNFYKSSSTWYYGRSRQSEHFIVFWAPGYRDRDPNSAEVPEAYRVDIDDLLEKAEEFYETNITTLKFAETGVGKSKLDQYKM